MKRKLDLRTGKPVWLGYRAPAVEAATVSRNLTADVLVIGLGISGAMLCDALSQVGLKVVGVDRRRPLAGSTPATTALVQFEIDQPLSVLSGKIGKDRAVRAWRRSRLAVTNLHARIVDLEIDCRAALRPSLYLSGTEMGATELDAEAEARLEAGLYARRLKPAELEARYGIAGRSALISEGNLALDPRRLSAGLLNAAAERGARYYRSAEVTGIEPSGGGMVAALSTGETIEAARVVVATGYELLDVMPKVPHRVVSTWAIATRRQPRAIWPREAFIWEASEPYLYLRATHDGRVICGGEDEDFSDEKRRDALIDEKTKTISQKLKRLMPDLDVEPEFRWAGSFGTTATGLPFIGRLPRKPGLFAVMGYGGNGITYSRIAAEIITTQILGGTDPDADLYAFEA